MLRLYTCKSVREMRARTSSWIEVLGAALDEVHRFGGEAVEGSYTEFEMVFFCVFDFVVADAAEGLDEHHYCGDSGAGDFGSVVERT